MKIGTTPIVSVKSGNTPIQKVYSGVNLIWSSVDPDAQAFITAASITNPTQQTAIEQLVTDLKGYGVWTKLRACYPFIGGTASSHKFNLKDPRDLDAAFRLVFNGGWTHSATGALPNGANGFANTFLNPSTNLLIDNSHISIYSRTNNGELRAAIGSQFTGTQRFLIWPRITSETFLINNSDAPTGIANSDSRGLFINNRVSSTGTRGMIRGVQHNRTVTSSATYFNANITIGTVSTYYDNREYAFSSIGDGLTDVDLSNLTTAVQTFQVTLGRSIGTQTVSDADAQAFVTNAGIVDQVEANAVNNLVIGLKADGLWSKMKAVYPFVGSSASSHKYNLRNPLDTDAAFRLVFNGGWTHSSTGALPNGTNAFADSKLIPSAQLSLNSTHISYYSRTNGATGNCFGAANAGLTNRTLWQFGGGTNYIAIYTEPSFYFNYGGATSSSMLIANRTASNLSNAWAAGIKKQTSTNASVSLTSVAVYLGGNNANGTADTFSNAQCAFASIGDGLTDTEAANFYTRVQAFNTTLNRQV